MRPAWTMPADNVVERSPRARIWIALLDVNSERFGPRASDARSKGRRRATWRGLPPGGAKRVRVDQLEAT